MRTIADTHRNVQVTLQIITAMIEKTPRDLSLYSSSVLTILNTVLKSKDINMVEESVPTFEAYCKHVNAASLVADQERSKQYFSLIETYSAMAEKGQEDKARRSESVPMSLRWRTAGLRGIRAAVGSEAIVADSARQLNLVMTTILDNMSLEDGSILSSLQQRARSSEKFDVEMARKRRLSTATVSTVDTVEGQPLTVSETTADADKAAEDDVKILAVRCLKQIFSVGISTSRGQTRLATVLVLKFVATKNPTRIPLQRLQHGTWATELFETIVRWTPVQDRFIIVLTAMETLVRSPIVENVLEKQLVLVTMIDWLLSSDINLIGLSVMDVLLGLIQHTLLLLQLGGRDSKIAPHHQPTDTLGFSREVRNTLDPGSVLVDASRGRTADSVETKPSAIRQDLLVRLQKCIAALSNHIYYTDQISDMLTAILARLKPSVTSEIPNAAAAVKDPAAAMRAVTESVSLQEDSSTDAFFSFTTARVTALRAIKDILMRANNRRTSSGASMESRSRVGVQVWEGTQWLLKDADADVRTAYVDALLTWLRLETNKNDQLLPRDGPRQKKSTKKPNGPNGEASAAKRAASNASRKESKPKRSAFLQLLHLAIYDGILDNANSDSDVLLLYLLLTKLVERLGVNALRTGLPMILRLQEAALNREDGLSANATVNVASLVHGYLWSMAEKFEFETNKVGHEINAEMSRRKRFTIWFDRIKFPALALDNIRSQSSPSEKTPVYHEDHIGTMKPFLNIGELVEEIANAYDTALLTPTNSPPSSPGRVFSVPTLGFGYGYGVAPGPKPSTKDQLPQRIKDELGAGWTREACIAQIEKELAGSFTGTSSGARQHLSVKSAGRNDSVDANIATNTGEAGGAGLYGGLGTLQKGRNTSNGSPAGLTTSSRDSTLKVTELKRALSGYTSNSRTASPLGRHLNNSRRSVTSSGSDSMVSWNDADDRAAPTTNVVGAPPTVTRAVNGVDKPDSLPVIDESTKKAEGDSTYHDQVTAPTPATDVRLGDDVPPVPKIPSNFDVPGTYPRDASPVRPSPADLKLAKRRSRDSKRVASSSHASTSLRDLKRSSRPPSSAAGGAFWNDGRAASEKVDVKSLLAGIESSSSAQQLAEKESASRLSVRLSKPPY